MSKKMKILISVLVAILVFAIGGATMALAQEDDEDAPEEEELTQEAFPGIGSSELLSRVAEKLGITEDELKEAIQEAREEMAEERLTDYLNDLLEKALTEGLINESEAQEIRDWWADRPEALSPGLLKRALRAMHPSLGSWRDDGEHNFPRIKNLPPEVRDKLMERLRDRIRLSDERASGTGAWRSGQPAAFSNPSRIRVLKAERARQQVALSEEYEAED